MYQAIIGPFADTHHCEMRLAQLPRSATAFSAPEHVEDQRDNTHSPSTPGLAMANGKVYTAWNGTWTPPTPATAGASTTDPSKVGLAYFRQP